MLNAGWPTSEDIAAFAAQAVFGQRLVTNVYRGLIAEAIVAQALDYSWDWCSADYNSWDFERSDGTRLEIKQAASRQSWHRASDPPSRISFDIRSRKGRYEGAQWIAETRRWADIYIFAHHHVISERADQRDPVQWDFYVVPETSLPGTQRISLTRVRSLAKALNFAGLADAVASNVRT